MTMEKKYFQIYLIIQVHKIYIIVPEIPLLLLLETHVQTVTPPNPRHFTLLLHLSPKMDISCHLFLSPLSNIQT